MLLLSTFMFTFADTYRTLQRKKNWLLRSVTLTLDVASNGLLADRRCLRNSAPSVLPVVDWTSLSILWRKLVSKPIKCAKDAKGP